MSDFKAKMHPTGGAYSAPLGPLAGFKRANDTLSVDQAFVDFVTVLQYALEHGTVTVRERDPPYITPPIRVLLRKRNCGVAKLTAQLITIKIGKMIASVRSKMLSKATASDTKQLWQLLPSTRNWSHVATGLMLPLTLLLRAVA